MRKGGKGSKLIDFKMCDSSDEEYDEQNWVFYKDRPEWKDVKPVPQDDGEEPVVAIAYSKKCE